MNTMQNLFQQAQLAEAAYTDLTDVTTSTPPDELAAILVNSNRDGKFSESQAAEFVKHWQVVDQYTASGGLWGEGSGFSATVFKNIQTGQYVFAIRGTAGLVDLAADYGDIVLDGLAMDQIVDMYNYWQSLNHAGVYQAAKLEDSIAETAALNLLPPGIQRDAAIAALKASGAILDSTLGGLAIQVRRFTFGDSNDLLADTPLALGSGKLAVSPDLVVTGHSLGGHLAAAFTRLFPGMATAVTINGAGYPTGNTPGLGGNALHNIETLFECTRIYCPQIC